MTEQLDLFSNDNSNEDKKAFKFSTQKYATFKSAIDASKFRYKWFVNTLDSQKGLLSIVGRYKLSSQQLQSLLDQHKVIINKINVTYQIWIDKLYFKK